jgi:hypothetical protein
VTYTFNTAWSAPTRVIKALAAQYPTLTVVHEWTDEDSSGSNHGRTTYEDGEETGTETFDGNHPTEDLVQLATELKGRNPYHPRCETCDDDLTEEEIAGQTMEHRRWGTCDECKVKRAKVGK